MVDKPTSQYAEQESLPKKQRIADPPLRNGLMHSRIKEQTELPADFIVTFADISGQIADSDALVAAFASKQNALGYNPLNPSFNLADLEDVAEARANLGLTVGGDGDIWLTKSGGTMTGPILLAAVRPLQFQTGTVAAVQGLMDFSGKQFFVVPATTRRALESVSDVIDATVAVVNTTTETDIFGASLDVNALSVKHILRLLLYGRYSTASGVDTLTIRFKVNGSTILSFVTTAGAVTNAPLFAEFMSTMRLIGASGVYRSYLQAVANNVNKHQTTTADQALDTTAIVALSITAQWSAAAAGNTLSIDQALLETS